eukprot:CAMPEP_0170539614 /NCGR_PEP_ID=MMETSP0209-20121228/104057_1 /TAXON_ID=665100 ORGANISM="Litonotus pictus, Strain P1" /NCGR_SAMPLE_ID=MMETSP0209 /ASSEMBLY_ACC=CAM_ASM_000301 /LENGTH=176 /DNA_ID=CAMNT_0010841623 /DNA_START=98 /DNA_END=629 /DNA_ORIENTATION=-
MKHYPLAIRIKIMKKKRTMKSPKIIWIRKRKKVIKKAKKMMIQTITGSKKKYQKKYCSTMEEHFLYITHNYIEIIQVEMNNSFSGFLTNDLRILEEIMKFERNMKRNPKIIEELKAKNPSDTKGIALSLSEALPLGNKNEENEEEENHDEFQNSLDMEEKKGDQESKEDDDSAITG